jgi:hypothetical protein
LTLESIAPGDIESSVLMSQAPSCSVCGGTVMREDEDANLYCVVCGTLCQDVIAEDLEYDQGMVGGYGIRYGRNRRIDASTLGSAEDLTWRVTCTFFDAFQELLQQQCLVLVRDFGCPPSLISVVGRVWVVFLDDCQHRDPHLRVSLTGMKLLQRASRTGVRAKRRKYPEATAGRATGTPAGTSEETDDDDDDEDDDHDDTDDDADTDGVDAGGRNEHDAAARSDGSNPPQRQSDVGIFPLSLTLVLQYIGLVLLRVPVSAADLVAWTQCASPRIPFFGALTCGLTEATRRLVMNQIDLRRHFCPRRC